MGVQSGKKQCIGVIVFQLFDDILTEDEGQLVLDDAIASVEILQEDYHSIFLISKEILGSENSQERYLERCRRNFLPFLRG